MLDRLDLPIVSRYPRPKTYGTKQLEKRYKLACVKIQLMPQVHISSAE